jgi:hypothetical protein
MSNNKKSEISFWKSLQEFSFRRLIISIGFFSSIVASGIYGYSLFFSCSLCEKYETLASVLTNAATGLFSILFAAFAIIIAVADKKFVSLLKNLGILNSLLFPFWLTSFLYLISIIVNLLVSLVSQSLNMYIAVIGFFTFSWAIAETFYLVSTTVKFGLYRAEIYSLIDKSAGDKSDNE